MEHDRTLADRDNSVLMVIDIQERLAAAMPQDVREHVVEQVEVLLTAADCLSVPVVTTLQYPKGLGPLEDPLQKKLPAGAPVIEKTCFSSLQVEAVSEFLSKTGRRQIFLTGMEAHICILQTAMDLLVQGYDVFIIEDGISSRARHNQLNALQRLRQAGAVITNTESVLFEWLRDATHPAFKKLTKLIV